MGLFIYNKFLFQSGPLFIPTCPLLSEKHIGDRRGRVGWFAVMGEKRNKNFERRTAGINVFVKWESVSI